MLYSRLVADAAEPFRQAVRHALSPNECQNAHPAVGCDYNFKVCDEFNLGKISLLYCQTHRDHQMKRIALGCPPYMKIQSVPNVEALAVKELKGLTHWLPDHVS